MSSSPRIIADDLDHAQIAVIATIPLGFRVPVVRWFGHSLIDQLFSWDGEVYS